MMRRIALLLAFVALPAFAQAADFVCAATAGTAIYSVDTVPPGTNQPTQCRLLSNGVQISSGPTIPSSTLSVSPITPCQPVRANYNPGPVGSVACSLGTGALAVGTYSFTFYWSNVSALGVVQEAGPSPPVVIQVVTALTTAPPAPVLKMVPR